MASLDERDTGGQGPAGVATGRVRTPFGPDRAQPMPTVTELLTWGLSQHQAGNVTGAEQAYRQILEAMPQHAEAWHYLGLLAYQTRRPQLALECFQKSLQLMPRHPVFWSNYASFLGAQGRLEEAVLCCHRAIQANPAFADAHYNLGTMFDRLGRPDQAVAAYRQAVALQPENALIHNNLGLALTELGQPHEAVGHFEEAIRLQPDYARAHWNLSLTLLLLGDWARGWEEYQWRTRCRELPTMTYPQPVWDGSPLEGRTILLHAEQGLGDMIQFIRYAPLVKARGGRVVVLAPPSLRRLFERVPGVDALALTGGPTPPFDVHCPLLSLPRLFGTRLDNVPAEVPYLSVSPELVRYWRPRLDVPGFRVGLVWQGRPTHARDRLRSLPLERLAPLLDLDGVCWFSLQKGHGAEQLAAASFAAAIVDLGSHVTDLADTAAVVQQLDLLISVDTAPAHLAGALGVPVWVLLPFVPDWRWLLGRDDSPWYPSMRLFRQPRHGDWDAVVQAVAAALRTQVSRGP